MQKLRSGDFMFRVRILEGTLRKTRPFLQKCLKKAALEGTINAALCSGDADLLIVPRGAEMPSGAGAKVLLTVGAACPGGVSCGLGSADALTLSSIREGRAMLSLSRELTTLSGEILEPQDIPVTLSAAPSPEPEALAAAAGAMLILGAGTEGLRV